MMAIALNSHCVHDIHIHECYICLHLVGVSLYVTIALFGALCRQDRCPCSVTGSWLVDRPTAMTAISGIRAREL